MIYDKIHIKYHSNLEKYTIPFAKRFNGTDNVVILDTCNDHIISKLKKLSGGFILKADGFDYNLNLYDISKYIVISISTTYNLLISSDLVLDIDENGNVTVVKNRYSSSKDIPTVIKAYNRDTIIDEILNNN